MGTEIGVKLLLDPEVMAVIIEGRKTKVAVATTPSVSYKEGKEMEKTIGRMLMEGIYLRLSELPGEGPVVFTLVAKRDEEE